MNWTVYLIQVNIYLIAFYILYKMLLAKETYFVANRIYLISSGLLALLIPAIRLEWIAKQPAAQQMNINFDELSLLMVTPLPHAQGHTWQWGHAVALTYLLGALIFTTLFFVKLLQVRRLLKSDDLMALSFFKHKRVSKSLQQSDVINSHEEIHIRQWHSIDLMFTELLGILNWFNPVIYLYKRELKILHEYLADDCAVRYQGNKKAYAMLLLSEAMGVQSHQLTNSFFSQKMLKQRIAMLFRQRSAKRAILKYGFAVPLFALSLMLSATTLRENKTLTNIASEIPLDGLADLKETINQPLATAKTIINEKPKNLKEMKSIIKKVALAGTLMASVTVNAQTDAVKTSIKEDVIVVGHPKTEPVYYIDGKKAEQAEIKALKSEKIEHIHVLKGQSAVDLVGAEGKDGLILITTKGGKMDASFKQRLTKVMHDNQLKTQQSFVKGFPADKPPLFVVDGKVTSKADFEKLDKNEIEVIR